MSNVFGTAARQHGDGIGAFLGVARQWETFWASLNRTTVV